jgi:signal transduction histidine kinase
VALPWIIAILALLLALGIGVLWGARHRRLEAFQEEVQRLRRALEEAQEARDTFFDLVTHELRSPLTAILGYQELLADGAYGDVADRMSEPIDRIGRSARHLLHLIDGVVELSRLRTGNVRPDLGPVNLDVLVGSVADAFRVVARERGVTAHVEIPDDLPTIRSDQDRLVRALDLMMTSAVKHPAHSDLHLRVTPSDHGLSLHVGETAIGIREDTDDLALRLGIRLAVADGIARVLGGGLDLETDEAGLIRGLTFHVHDPDPGL